MPDEKTADVMFTGAELATLLDAIVSHSEYTSDAPVFDTHRNVRRKIAEAYDRWQRETGVHS